MHAGVPGLGLLRTGEPTERQLGVPQVGAGWGGPAYGHRLFSGEIKVIWR